jgi:hypothetical protein
MRAKGLADPAIIAAITIFTGVLSGSERWAGLDTPDSSFYASLGLFGDEVTDRSVEQSYYWTRLGYLVPVRVLTGALGPWTGFAAYRLILLLVIVAAVYLTMRRFTTRPSAAFITTAISLNTVVLSYLGNTYLTGSVLAGTAALIALALNDRRIAAVLAGFVLGWLIMVNPVGALLSGTIWLTIRIHARTRLSHLGFTAAMAVATFGAFLLAGRLMFPRMDWFETFFETQQITLSNFASKSPVWLGDISLLVPAGILVISIVAWALNRGSHPAQLALMISSSSIAFMLVFTPLMGGIALEAPMYQAMLWPPALIALGLVNSSAVGDRRWTPAAYGCAAIALAAVLLAGHWPGGMPFALGVAAIVVLVAAVILGVRSRQLVITLLALAVFLAGAQLLQNSRGPLGLYYLSPYNWAFNANPVSDKLHTAVNTQEWLLANTSRDDRILDWVGGDWVGGDRELYVVAGMQLWGENRVTLEPVLTPDDVARLDSLRPSVIAMYAPSRERVTAFWASIPEANRASLPICYDFAWAPSPDTEAAKNPAPVNEGHACLTRLTWAD